MKWPRRLLAIVVGVAVIGLVVWAFLPAPVDVDLGRSERGDILITVDHEGKTRVKQRYEVTAPLAGRLRRITLRPGDPVVAGETLLALIEPVDPALLDARARAEAEARVDAAEAARSQAVSNQERALVLHAQARRDLERIQQLRNQRNATEQEYNTAIFDEQAAAAALRSAEFATQIAEFEVRQARAALIQTRPTEPESKFSARFEIHSPITGRVLRLTQESSTVVTPGTKLLEVGDPTDLECEIDVLSNDAVKIEPRQRVILEHWGGRAPLEGRVRVREPSAFTKISALGVEEQRVNIIADLLDSVPTRAALGDAYRVEARIVIGEARGVVKVPAGSLFRHGDGWAVFRVDTDRAWLRPVKVGATNGLETEIQEGLKPGDIVVLHPSDRVSDGVKIQARSSIPDKADLSGETRSQVR